MHDGRVLSVSWGPESKTLASASGDKTVKLWDAATGKEKAILQGHTAAVWSVSWSPDGKTLSSGDWNGTVKQWDAATGKELATLKGHADVVSVLWPSPNLSWSPDGKTPQQPQRGRTDRDAHWAHV